MALVMRTISTYMLVKHSKNGKEKAETKIQKVKAKVKAKT
jgi:hypothetical protein